MRIRATILLLVAACVEPIDSDIGLDDEHADAAMGPLELSSVRRGFLDIELRDSNWMAWLSSRAYLEPVDFEARVHEVAKSARVSWFFAASTQAYYVDLGNAAVLVFRGSEKTTADWRFNFKTSLIPALDGNVHSGFDEALATVWDFRPESFGGEATGEPLRAFLATRHGTHTTVIEGAARVDHKRLYITGHSLGGALAMVAYVRAETDGCQRNERIADPALCMGGTANKPAWWIPVHAVHTFGAPRIGDLEFGRLASAPLRGSDRIVFRYVNRGDLVANVPDATFGYSHPRIVNEAEFLIHIGHNDEISIGGSTTTHPASITDHDIGNYQRALHTGRVVL